MQEPTAGRDHHDDEVPAQPVPNQGMGALLKEHEPGSKLRRGDIVDGTVVRVDRDGVLVDIGAKSEAVIPVHEIPPQELEELETGSPVVAYVLQPEDHEGHAVLSLARAQAERGWRRLQKHFEDGDVLEGTVVESNKGGLIVNLQGVRGFVPLSQVAELRRAVPAEEGAEDKLRTQAGRRVYVKIIEMNRRRNRLILSERAALQQRRTLEKERLLAELQPGDVRRGVVSSVCDFGAFVDLGGADGLIHLSELSWGQVAHPSAVVQVGQELDVHVVAVDREKKKIALSLKRLQEEPWSHITEKFQVGQFVSGRITKLAAFGAFAEIEDGIEGLVHISELSDQRITHPKQVVREGDRIQVRILRIDPARRRLGLSLRQGGYVYETPADADQPATGIEVAPIEVAPLEEVAALDETRASVSDVQQAVPAQPEDRASEDNGAESEHAPASEREAQGARK
ncbi:MAG: S1 RNA-binding domain-containing protein [Chloroflexi bacterium]|nr:S1 RNA-binding domain-containing protein [Chloroflexota bacterium]